MVDHLSKLQNFTEDHLFLQVLNKPSQLSAKVEILMRTKLYEKLTEAFHQLHSKDPSPQELPVLSDKQRIDEQLIDLEKRVQVLVNSKEDLLNNEIGLIKTCASLHYDQGHYEEALKLLSELRRVDHIESWGEMITNILLHKLDRAQSIAEDMINEIHEPKDKAWLLHSILFISFPNKPSFFFDICSHSKFSNTIEVGCPHLIRYLLSSSLLKRSGRTFELILAFKNAFKLDSGLESFTQYFEDYDVEQALSSLSKFSDLIKEDYFLSSLERDLVREAKKFFVFCHLKLNKQVETAWIEKVISEDVGKIMKELSGEYKLHSEHQGKFVMRARN